MKKIVLVFAICLFAGFTYIGYSVDQDNSTKTEAVAGDDDSKTEAEAKKEETKDTKSCEKKCPKSEECKSKSKSTDDKK